MENVASNGTKKLLPPKRQQETDKRNIRRSVYLRPAVMIAI